jgi:hypothetical protein
VRRECIANQVLRRWLAYISQSNISDIGDSTHLFSPIGAAGW